MSKTLSHMEKITKAEFKRQAKEGLYFFKALWTTQEEPLITIQDYVFKIKEIEMYKRKEYTKELMNSSANMRFKNHDGSFSYLFIEGQNCTVYKIGWFFVVHFWYKETKQHNIVMYIHKDAKNHKNIQIDPELFIKKLPSGSGIDSDWEYKEYKNGKVKFLNWFHAMDEHGGYDGYMKFQFTVFYDPIRDQFDFSRLICNENAKKSFFGLKEYLEDTIYAAIVGNIDPNKHLKEK